MKFALNYSTQAARLVRERLISVDLLKCPDFPEMVSEARAVGPTYVHFGLEVGSGKLAGVDWGAVERLREETGTKLVNLHLVARQRDWSGVERDASDLGILGKVLERWVGEVTAVCSRFGAENVMVENLIYHGPARDGFPQAEDWLLAGVHPAVISEVVEQTGCGLLLDTSHARIACHYQGWDPRDYIEQLPVKKLRELHVTGLAWHEGMLVDHMPMGEEDWVFFREAMRAIREGRWGQPGIVAFEYGGGGPFEWRSDAGVMAGQVPMMVEDVRRG